VLHLYADVGVEDEVLHTYGTVMRVGTDPSPNPFSEVVQGDARNPPVSGRFDLAVAHPPCQRFSRQTRNEDRERHPDYIDEARRVCREYAEHYIIENVPQAPLRDPVTLTGGMFGIPIHYPRAFETSFPVPEPDRSPRFQPECGPLSEQGEKGKAWVGTNEGWRLAKGYGHDWPARGLKRHAVPSPYLRRLLYHWLAAVESGTRSEQQSLGAYPAATDGGVRQ